MCKNIEGRFEKDVEQFRRSIEKAVKQFEDRIKNSLENLEYINTNSDFNFDININSGTH
ncbi:Uncharacterised protein [Helicobacter acinonychis]|uniref:Uncharacterized protein n=1 Tax=Helicobacter acinonychis (strain Sheeba) TaxID=382638 RepID=Q17XY4_HELAH|nr:hypothetical protein fragment 3 [Helicobacter acinonychis str. Sheeba]STP04065.1 Uncharacterised protein [Helicobacter acinonychis]